MTRVTGLYMNMNQLNNHSWFITTLNQANLPPRETALYIYIRNIPSVLVGGTGAKWGCDRTTKFLFAFSGLWTQKWDYIRLEWNPLDHSVLNWFSFFFYSQYVQYYHHQQQLVKIWLIGIKDLPAEFSQIPQWDTWAQYQEQSWKHHPAEHNMHNTIIISSS